MSPAPPADAVYRRSDGASAATVDDLVVLLNVDAGKYHGLNAVGSLIWEALSEPRSIRDLAADLTRQFEVDLAEADRATRAFLSDLAERGLVEREVS
ncbi:PqqD family protein [Rubrivirga sp.]|uniref:PqqD family protein n=1 Tax=Rubrivirga sp. TaxID=1885344 RepID=UPI003B522BE0